MFKTLFDCTRGRSGFALGAALALIMGLVADAGAQTLNGPAAGDDLIGAIRHTRAHQEDTLIDIARRFSVGQEEMMMANPTVDRWLPKEGTDVLIPQQYIIPEAPRAGVIVNIPEMRLYYFPIKSVARAPVSKKKQVSMPCEKPRVQAAVASKPGASKSTMATPMKPGQAKSSSKTGSSPPTGGSKVAQSVTNKATPTKPKTSAPAKSASGKAVAPAKSAKPCVVVKEVAVHEPAPAAEFESSSSEVITYPVSMGRMDWRTPIGKTSVVHKQENPSWTPPASIKREHAAKGDPLPDVVPPGPDNPLGKFAMRLGVAGYLIHGTDAAKADGIGMRVTHGCMRLYNEDIAKLFPLVPVGTPVYLVNQPVKLGWQGDKLYMEVSQPLDEEVGISPHDPDDNISKAQLDREDEDRSEYLLKLARSEIQKVKDARGATVSMDRVRRAIAKPTGIPVAIGGLGISGQDLTGDDVGFAPEPKPESSEASTPVQPVKPAAKPIRPPSPPVQTEESIDSSTDQEGASRSYSRRATVTPYGETSENATSRPYSSESGSAVRTTPYGAEDAPSTNEPDPEEE